MFNLLSATTFEIKRLNALKNTEAEIYLLRTRNVKEKNNQGVKIFKFKKKRKGQQDANIASMFSSSLQLHKSMDFE